MNELINFDGLGEVIVNFTNKLADGIGWIANKETPKKIALNTYIKEIQEKDYDPVTKAALISNTKQIIKEYCNQNNIVEIAMQSLQSDAKSENVEDDWLGRFMDGARLVSSKEFQWIWGRILAKECNKPGSIPLVLLYTLEKMDKEDAEAFTALCRIAVKFEEEYTPIIIGSKLDEYKSLVGINLEKLLNLNALGLIEMDLGVFASGYKLEAETVAAKVIYFDKEFELDEENDIAVGNVLFTKAGQALCQSIDVNMIEGFWEAYCLPFWKGNGNTLATENQ
ncbi:MAG: DUF2806 domain-containing protein [Eubacterium sp.]|nr:DUF2806 domain-containing protein [Eubacterium sp.]